MCGRVPHSGALCAQEWELIAGAPFLRVLCARVGVERPPSLKSLTQRPPNSGVYFDVLEAIFLTMARTSFRSLSLRFAE